MDKRLAEAVAKAKKAFDDAIYDAPLVEAIEAAEDVLDHVDAVLDGMRCDLANKQEG